jgi:hypothetical protein
VCQALKGFTHAPNNGLATQTRQLPTRDNARTSYQNQNQNIKILLYYTTTMSSTTPKSLSLSKEDCMQIVLQLLKANPDLSGRELAKIYNLLPSSVYHRRNGR